MSDHSGTPHPLDSTGGENIAEIGSVALNAVPFVGGSLARIGDAVIQRMQNRRLQQFLARLAADLDGLHARVGADFVPTEEFHDLAEDIFSKASEARQQESLDALRSIFVNTVLSEHPSYDDALEVAKLVSSWQ